MPNGKTGLTLRFLGQGNPSIVILLPDLPPGFSEFDTEDDRVAVWFLAVRYAWPENLEASDDGGPA